MEKGRPKVGQEEVVCVSKDFRRSAAMYISLDHQCILVCEKSVDAVTLD